MMVMVSCLTIVHYQLEKHRAPASAAHLQVDTCLTCIASVATPLQATV